MIKTMRQRLRRPPPPRLTARQREEPLSTSASSSLPSTYIHTGRQLSTYLVTIKSPQLCCNIDPLERGTHLSETQFGHHQIRINLHMKSIIIITYINSPCMRINQCRWIGTNMITMKWHRHSRHMLASPFEQLTHSFSRERE